jgi:hypothetical protein
MHAFIRALVAALAVAAIAAPAALARPIDPVTPQTQEPAAEAPPREAPARPLDRYTPEAQKSVPFGPEGPLYWGYDYEAGVPQDSSAGTGGDTPWAIVGLAIAGGCLLLSGAALATRSRARRAHLTA